MATILIVEDDPLISMTAVDMVIDLGHQPIEAYSGTQALALLEANASIDLLMTDQAMPGMTGMDLARKARSLYPSLPILITTGYPDLQDADGLGVVCVSKPYVQQQLTDAFGRLLARSPTGNTRRGS